MICAPQNFDLNRRKQNQGTTKFKIVLRFLCCLLFTPALGAIGDEPHWAYKPVERPVVRTIDHFQIAQNPIDRLTANQSEGESAKVTRQADRVTLIRRVSLDLIGLPPTPDEVREFVNDRRPDAFEQLVDRLLASPHYGEHWARSWLDLCHYADTDGYLTDQARPVAWRYRAWLVDALNENLPFDEFTIQQLAGDLLPNATTNQRLATGFLRQTLSNREGGADPVEFRVKQVVDRTSMVGEIWMGLTVGCAQCHDHKYDDISQQEFYELFAFLDSADEINIDAPLPGEKEPYESALPDYHRKRRELLAPLASEIDKLQRRWEAKLLEARDNPGQDWYWDRQWELVGLVWGGNLGEGQLEGWQIVMLDPKKRSQLQKDRLLDYFLPKADTIDAAKAKELKLGALNSELRKLKAALPKVTRAPTMMNTQNPRTTFVHIAGDFRDRGDDVTPSTPDVLPQLEAKHLDRLALARWLVSAEHPLTSRVAVNRMWQLFFGDGIVETVGDFGVRGTPPTNPQLLDWLASEFVRSGWDVKVMHRKIVTSATYRQSSDHSPSDERSSSRLPGTKSKLEDRSGGEGSSLGERRLQFRQTAQQLTAEQVRDSILATSGLLDSRIGGPSVKPPQPRSVVEQSYGNKWEPSDGGDRYRRSIYTWVQRTSPFAMHITFDAPNPNHICTKRDRSNTPLQALTLLNEPAFHEAAAALAARVQREVNGDDVERITHAFRICLSRKPQSKELSVFSQLLAELRKEANSDEAAWTTLCSVFFNLHEFVTRN